MCRIHHFEDTIYCPFGPGAMISLSGWDRVYGTVDYHNECNGNQVGVPHNYAGVQFARQGLAYSGLAIWSKTISNAREFIGVSLDQPLEPDQRYLVRYHLSKADTVQYALRNFGAWFTTAQPPDDLGVLLNAEPQVTYEGEAFLDDQDGWMTIEGSFIAEGGEQFLTLGNFDDDANTDTLFVVEQTSKSAYYYLDDVSVVEDTSYHVGVDDMPALPREYHKLYPNPNNGSFTLWLQMNEEDNAEIVVWDVTGRKAHQSMATQGENAVELNVSSGLYLYGVLLNGKVKWTGKVSVDMD